METKEIVLRIMQAAEKLLTETKRLARDVEVLNGRIQKFDDEVILPRDTDKPRKAWNFADAMNIIEDARKRIRNCEYELNAIRGRMDAIESDAISREEMKPFIK